MKPFLQRHRWAVLAIIMLSQIHHYQLHAQATGLLHNSGQSGWKEISSETDLKNDLKDGFQCGDPFTDPRDGQVYPTVLIGSQCWMAKNLNFGNAIPQTTAMTNNGIAEKHCYEDNPANCDTYGGLYQWDEMMQYTLTQGIKGLCPDGWHIPTDAEWCTLETTVDPTINCSSIFWRGADGGTKLKAGGSSGFEGLLGGYIFSAMTSNELGTFGYFWTSTTYNDTWRYIRGLGLTQPGVRRMYNPKENSYSVRCLRGPGAVNLPPSQPASPNPANGAVNQSVGTILSWQCTDPENDALTFDVYLGTSSNPPLLASNVTGITFNPGSLQYQKTYYWKIVAKDTQGNSTTGPIWSFTTHAQSGLFVCGQVYTDSRDGQQYNTKKIGNQCWMSENMNIGVRIESSVAQTNNSVIEKYCYNNLQSNCDTYGGLYQWDEMMQYTTIQGAQGICPSGWRLATDNEWKELEGNADSQYPVGNSVWDEWGWRGSDVSLNLKEVGTTHWSAPNTGATNSTGFTALPNGYAAGSSFIYLGQMGWFWTSTQHSTSNSIVRMLHFALATSNRADYSKVMAIGVRCIQSAAAPNEPPATPSNPNPAQGSTGRPLNQTLSWSCSDPDGDPLTYDVYFGANANPPLVAEGISQNTFNPGTLEYYTQYFWKIVAHDDHDNSKEGPVWNFTTTQLFFSVTFNVQDESGNPLQNAVVTLNGVTNPQGNYLFPQIPVGAFNYKVEKTGFVTTYGQVTVVDQNVTVTVAMPELVVVSQFPFTEDFSGGQLPNGWRNVKINGDFNWEFATMPFPHTFIHNIGRPAVNSQLITPFLNATALGQVKIGINQRFMTTSPSGAISILISEDGLNWNTVAHYTASIGTGDDFEYLEFSLDQYAAGKQVFIALNADFPDADASYEAVWEVESLTVFQPDYTVTFNVEDLSGNAVENAIITLNGVTNTEGDYIFENIIAGTYPFVVKAEGFTSNYGFVTVTNENVTVNVVLTEAIVISEFPYYEDFEENVLPEGWNNIILGHPDGYWRFQGQMAQIQSGWGLRTHTRLVTPAFDCSNLVAVAIGLNHYYMDIYGVGFAEIQISYDGDNWITVEHFQGQSVGNNNCPYFEYYVTELAAGQERVYIGFLYDDLSSTEFWWLINAFRIFEPQPYEFSLTNLTGNKYVNEGESLTYEFQIVNMGSENDTYDLEVLNASWNYEMSHTSIAVNSTEVALATVTVFVPADIEMGEKEELILKVSSHGHETLSRESIFTTVGVSTIKSYYFEDFDLAVVPDLPGGWSKIQQSTQYWARVQTQKSLGIPPASQPINIELYNSSDLNANLILISPKIDESVDLKDFRVLFKLRTGDNSGIKLGTMNSPTGTFTELATFSTPEHFTWEYYMYSFANYQGTNRYIAFKMNIFQANSGAYLDDITIELIPPPILKVTPESHNFGEYWMNYPSEVPLALDVRNVGHNYITVSSITLDNSSDFIIDVKSGMPANIYWNQAVPVDVYFNASAEGPRSGNIVIHYNDGEAKTKFIPLSGIGLPRPQGSICTDPIYLELPVVDYENTTQFAGNDYNNFTVFPWAGRLGGYDMDFSFTLTEESYVSASISGPYYGPSLYIVDRCPDYNNPAPLYAWIEQMYGGSFENVIMPAGDYLLIVSSPAAANPYTYYTPFVLNLSAVPTPSLHAVTFNLFEDSPEQASVTDALVTIKGFQTDLSLTSNLIGQVKADLYESEYQVHIYKKDYEVWNFTFIPTSDTIVQIPMKDLLWTPYGLNVTTAGLYPGQAHFTWVPKPQGEPWNESFEGNYPPNGWDTIVTNNGQILDPGVEWKFTWQKYGAVYFSDASAVPVDGQYQAFIHWSTDPQDEWLITHEFEAPAGDLEFWYYGRNGASYSDYFVKVSADNGQTWTAVWNASDLPSGRNNYDYPALVDLQPWAGQNIRLAWHAYGPDFGLYGAWCIDKISVGGMRINVEDLIYVSNSATPDSPETKGTVPSTRDEEFVPRVKMEDMGYDNSKTRVNKGFSVYLNDLNTPVAQGVQEPEFMFIGLDAGNYIAGVQAVTSTGQSEIVTIPFTNPTSGVLQNLTISVRNQSGVAISGAEVKIYYGGSLIKTLQTVNGSASTQLYAGDYNFTVFKSDYKTYFGSISITNSGSSINVMLEPGFQVVFAVMNLENEPIAMATVFCDGITRLTDSNGSALIELEAGIYPFTVTHPSYDRVLYSVNVQISMTQDVLMFPLSCEAPSLLTAQLAGGSAVLNWEEPQIGISGYWIHWDREHANNSVGNNGALDFQVAQRFTPTDLQIYDGKFLTRIWFVPREAQCDYSVRVWTGGNLSGPAQLIVDQPVINPIIGQWNEIYLVTPVFVDATKELWFGFRSNTSTGYPAGIDAGPAENGKGNMIRLPGGNWQTLLQINPNLNFNWSVRGLVESMDIRYMEPIALADDNPGSFSGTLEATNNAPDRNLYYPRQLLGYNVYRNGLQINNYIVPINSFTDLHLPFGLSNYRVTSVWSNDCESKFSNVATVSNSTQQYSLTSGWNSLSSFVIPVNPDVEAMFAPIVQNLTIMQNLTQTYWPAQGINTIGNFSNTTGYALKLTSPVAFEISGVDIASGSLNLTSGWHYLPVLSLCNVNVEQLFTGNLPSVHIVQDLIGTKVYWPEMNINTLGYLIPGRSYKVRLHSGITLQFPGCNNKSSTQPEPQQNQLETLWGEIIITPSSQIVAFTTSALDHIADGDIIGTFGKSGKPFGFVKINGNANQPVILYGNDPMSGSEVGFDEGEAITYKLFRVSTGEVFDLNVEYDATMDNATGKFYSGSFAAIVKASLNLTGIETMSASDFRMYPNPAGDVVYFESSGSADELIKIEVFDAKGQRVAEAEFFGRTQMNTAKLNAGIYFVKISTHAFTEVRKLIIQ